MDGYLSAHKRRIYRLTAQGRSCHVATRCLCEAAADKSRGSIQEFIWGTIMMGHNYGLAILNFHIIYLFTYQSSMFILVHI